MQTWTWTKMFDEDGHPYWKGRSSLRGGGSVVVWRAGGDSGEYLTENDDRRKTLKSAKHAAQAWAESQQ